MRTNYKYLLLLGLLPASITPSLAKAFTAPSIASTHHIYNAEKLIERNIIVGADGFKLPGTLTLPINASKDNKVPCLILVHGSGPNDRDETLGPNKPFRDLAWGLAKQGIATIRYDKRTRVYGAKCVPAGKELNYDTEAVDDAVATIAWADSIPEVAAEHIYVLGHSLGGSLAPRIAQHSNKLAGIIILAGLVRPLGETLIDQVTYIALLNGEPTAEMKAQIAMLRMQVDNAKKVGSMEFDPSISLPMGVPASYWMMENQYQPAETAASLNIPILILQGERDYQVTMLDYGLWQINLMGKPNATFKSYPKLNHLFQEGEGMATPQEYTQCIPVASYVIDDIAHFIQQKICKP